MHTPPENAGELRFPTCSFSEIKLGLMLFRSCEWLHFVVEPDFSDEKFGGRKEYALPFKPQRPRVQPKASQPHERCSVKRRLQVGASYRRLNNRTGKERNPLRHCYTAVPQQHQERFWESGGLWCLSLPSSLAVWLVSLVLSIAPGPSGGSDVTVRLHQVKVSVV